MHKSLSTLIALAAVVLLAAGCSQPTVGPNLDGARAPLASSVQLNKAGSAAPASDTSSVGTPSSGYIPGQGLITPSSGYIPGQGYVCDPAAELCP